MSTEPHARLCRGGNLTGVDSGVRAVASATCALSIIGAVLIILSYILIGEIRTNARKILLNISLMDLTYATGNLIGILINYDAHLGPDHSPASSALTNTCKAQAFFSMYGTISSILWTNCMAVYIYLHIMLQGRLKASPTMYTFYALCYGLPLIVSLWFVLTGKLGYSPYGGSGWCGIIIYNPLTKIHYPLNAVFANDMWIYLTVIIVPLIIISLKSMPTNSRKVEMQFLFVPFFFILLRVWSLVLTVIVVEDGKMLNCPTLLFFMYMGGIGDSGQGFANAILFVLFTPKVRRYFLHLLLCTWLCRRLKLSGSINNQGKSKVFYGAVESSDDHDQRIDLLQDSPEPSKDKL